MLVLVVIMFTLCWLPLQTFFLVLDFNPQLLENASRADHRMFTVIYYTVFWLAMSNSCANPIIYGFTNESFRSDLAKLCYVRFPFCLCLKHIANRRPSMSTFESTYIKRFGTVRQSPGTSISQQGGCRNGSKVYIELQKGMSRTRSQPIMSEYYKKMLEQEKLSKYPNGRRPRHQSYQYRYNNYNHLHNYRPFLRSESGDSTQPLNAYNHFEYNRVNSIPSPNDSDRSKGPSSPSASITTNFSFSRADDNYILGKLNRLHEVETSDKIDFTQV